MYLQKMIYRPHHNEGGLESGSSAHHVPGTPPPEYDSTHMEYPPDYQDALKDVILSTGMYMQIYQWTWTVRLKFIILCTIFC